MKAGQEKDVRQIPVVCVENVGRSQMAEAFAKYYGRGKVEVVSAGTKSAKHVNPVVVAVMREKGIDISKNRPKLLNAKMVEQAGVIVTMSCNAEDFCPAPMLKKVVDWGLEDPKGKSVQKVREIRDEIERRVLSLLKGS